MMNTLKPIVCAGLTMAAMNSVALAQGTNGSSPPDLQGSTLARYLTQDNRIPDSPAAAVLGIAPASVLHPTTPPEFHAALLNASDSYGNLQQGVALDINPFMLYAGDSFTLSTYKTDGFLRQLSNTTLSFATTKGTGDDDKATRAALGIHTNYFWNDPRLNENFWGCVDRDASLQKARRAYLAPTGAPPKPGEPIPPLSPPTVAEFEKIGTAAVDNCLKSNPPPVSGGLSFGFAPTWESQSAKLGGLDSQGYSVWASMSFGLPSDNGLLVFNLQRKTNQLSPNPQNTKTFIKEDLDIATTGLRFNGLQVQGLKDIVLSGDAGYVQANRDGLSDDTYWQYSGQLEFKIPDLAPDVTFDLSLGQTSGREKDDTFGRLALRWKFNDKSKATTLTDKKPS